MPTQPKNKKNDATPKPPAPEPGTSSKGAPLPDAKKTGRKVELTPPQPPVAAKASPPKKDEPERSVWARYGVLGVLVMAFIGAILAFVLSDHPTAPREAAPIGVASGTSTGETVLTPVAGLTALPTVPTETCTTYRPLEPDPTEAAYFPAVDENDMTLGSADAPVTILVYSDPQCPACAALEPVLRKLANDYGEDVQVVYRDFPLSEIHPNALLSAQAARAAGEQGKFWELSDILYGQQATWAGLDSNQLTTWLQEQAAALELDVDQFTADLTSPETVEAVAASRASAISLGLPGTPFVVINGRVYQGSRDYTSFESIIRLQAMADLQYDACPPVVIDTAKQYIATIRTSKGEVVVELYADKAPVTVNSFVFLAREGWFDGVIFHRVIPGFVAQTGDPSGTGYGGPGYIFINEINPDLNFDKAGMVGMANSGPNSNGSQFFITLDAASHLDGTYTVFGQVLTGMDVLNNLTERDPSLGGVLPEADTIISITIQEK